MVVVMMMGPWMLLGFACRFWDDEEGGFGE